MAQKVMEKQVQDRLRNLFASKKNALENEIEEENGNSREAKVAVPPFERNRDAENAQNRKAKNKKSLKQKERGMEPLTPEEEVAFQKYSSSDEKTMKARRTKQRAKKKQVRPEKTNRKGSMDPVGKDIPSRRYNDRGIERDTSPTPSATSIVDKSQQNRLCRIC